MPILLRTVRQNRWLVSEAQAFLDLDDAPADSVTDLAPTQRNMLSVWEVNEDGSNLERIVRAVAVGKHKIDNAGYLVFESKHLEEIGIQVLNVKGETVDEEANQWHRDLAVSGKKLVELAKVMLRHGTSNQILKVRMKELVVQGIKDGQLPESLLSKL